MFELLTFINKHPHTGLRNIIQIMNVFDKNIFEQAKENEYIRERESINIRLFKITEKGKEYLK